MPMNIEQCHSLCAKYIYNRIWAVFCSDEAFSLEDADRFVCWSVKWMLSRFASENIPGFASVNQASILFSLSAC